MKKNILAFASLLVIFTTQAQEPLSELHVEFTAREIPEKIAKGEKVAPILNLTLTAKNAPVKVQELWLSVNSSAPLEYQSIVGNYKNHSEYYRASQKTLFGYVAKLELVEVPVVNPGSPLEINVTAEFLNSFTTALKNDVWAVFNVVSSADKGFIKNQEIEAMNKAFLNEN